MARRKKADNKVVVGVMLPPDQQHQVVALATLRDWTVSKAGAYLIKLGLERLGEMQNGADHRARKTGALV